MRVHYFFPLNVGHYILTKQTCQISLNNYCMVRLDFGPSNIILLCWIFACADRYVHSMPFQFDDCIYWCRHVGLGRCIICGEDGDLRCPADRPDGEGGALLSYDDFLQNVDGFRQLHSLPVEVNDKELDSLNTLLQHRAKWHKSCRLKFARS